MTTMNIIIISIILLLIAGVVTFIVIKKSKKKKNSSTTVSTTIETSTETPENICDSTHLELCYEQADCEAAGGYWSDGKCLDHPVSTGDPIIDTSDSDETPEPVLCCDEEHQDLCYNQADCEAVGGYWFNGVCYHDAPEGYLKEKDLSNKPTIAMADNSKTLIPMSRKTDYFYSLGKCMYMLFPYYWVLNYVTKIWYWCYQDLIPENGDKRLYFGDFCGSFVDCEGHPAGSHKSGKNFDIFYFTTTNSNWTQGSYKHCSSSPWCAEIPYISIWKKDSQDKKYKDELAIDETIFDWERNYEFWKLLHNVFPDLTVMMDDRIKQYILLKLKSKYGLNSEEYNSFYKFSLGNTPRQYNHHGHAHIMCKDTINWEYIDNFKG